MPEEKKSYWTVFEKMTFKVEERAKLAYFDLKMAAKSPKMALFKILKKRLVVLRIFHETLWFPTLV